MLPPGEPPESFRAGERDLPLVVLRPGETSRKSVASVTKPASSASPGLMNNLQPRGSFSSLKSSGILP
jgi:hypothetical protein